MRHVVTDFRFPATFESHGESWQAERVDTFSAAAVLRSDLVVVNQDIKAGLLAKALGKKVVIVDVILRPPAGVKQHLVRFALGRIDYFIHYFRDVRGYKAAWGIGPDRSGYVPFKPNLRGRYVPSDREGGYIVCFGQSCRDYDTYFAATRGLNAVMPFRDLAILKEHGSLISGIPDHVRVIPNDGSQKDAAHILDDAMLVVVPIRKDNICSSSIGTYLNAMYLGKPCILTEGPGVSDVLTDQAVIVPPGDSEALRQAIDRVLSDDDFRRALAERGRRYAESLGESADLSLRVRDEAMRWWYSRRAA